MNENLEVYRSFRRVKDMMRKTPTMKDSLFLFSPFVWILGTISFPWLSAFTKVTLPSQGHGWSLAPAPSCQLKALAAVETTTTRGQQRRASSRGHVDSYSGQGGTASGHGRDRPWMLKRTSEQPRHTVWVLLGSKPVVLGMVIPPLIGNLFHRYITSLLLGNNGNLDLSVWEKIGSF